MRNSSIDLALGCLLALGLAGCVQSKAGASGTGGAGGTAGSAGTAGGSGANACGVHKEFRVKLRVRTIGPVGGALYDGPSVVERSTKDELLLAFDPAAASTPSAPDAGTSSDASPPDAGTSAEASTNDAGASSDASTFDAEAGDAGSMGPTMMHAVITGLVPMPVIPAGTELWLTKDPAGDLGDPGSYLPGPPWAISVRVGKGGPLLFGASFLVAPDDAAVPVKVGAVTPYCSGPDPDGCGNLTTVFSTVKILGDTPVTIPDSQSATVTIGGIAYKVGVHARGKTTGTMNCFDYTPPEGFALEVQALDMPALLAGAKMGALPACSVGNDPDPQVSISAPKYEGPVSYVGPDTFNSSVLDFSIPGQTGKAQVTKNAMPAPTLGQEFWLSAPDKTHVALLESQSGPLVVAVVNQDLLSSATTAWLSKVFGVPVAGGDQCQYAMPLYATAPIVSLPAVTIGAPPAITLTSGTQASFKLGARTYDAWLSSFERPNFQTDLYYYSLEVFAAP